MSRDLLSFEEALQQLLDASRPLQEVESIAAGEAAGRILARDLLSVVDVPPLDNSAMDGYVLRCVDLPFTGGRLPVSQRVAAGSIGQQLAPGTAARIFTGAPIPSGGDAVVMQERCVAEAGAVVINHLPRCGENIRRRGEDIVAGGRVLCRGTRLGPAQLGVAASVGAARLDVFRRLRVALFSTGDELAMPGEPLRPGAIYNSNRATLHSMLQGLGCAVTDYGIVPDNLESTRAVLREAANTHDMILTSGGVSVGEEDHLRPAVIAEGELTLWKIAIKPGKPFAFGQVARVAGSPSATAAFIGLPGNPVASFVTFLMLVRPYVRKAQGAESVFAQAFELRADFSWPGDARREFLRVRRNDRGGLDIFPSQGSGVLTSCAWADGLTDNPPGRAIVAGDLVSFIPFVELLG